MNKYCVKCNDKVVSNGIKAERDNGFIYYCNTCYRPKNREQIKTTQQDWWERYSSGQSLYARLVENGVIVENNRG